MAPNQTEPQPQTGMTHACSMIGAGSTLANLVSSAFRRTMVHHIYLQPRPCSHAHPRDAWRAPEETIVAGPTTLSTSLARTAA